MWVQRDVTLTARPRGLHIITDEVARALPEMRELRVGLVHLLLRHTSASLSVNENAAPAVRKDLEALLDDLAPESRRWRHDDEGPDDMPAHAKAALLGVQVTLPVREGRLALGTWQGLYLGEHRDHGGARRITTTIWGE